MRYLLILLCMVGCSTKAAVVDTPVKTDKEVLDLQFQVALNQLVETSHNEEMKAINEQRDSLVRIEESVQAVRSLVESEEVPQVDPEEETIVSEELPAVDLPKLWVTFTTGCAPCQRFKDDTENGELAGFDIREDEEGEGLRPERPAIRFVWETSPTGYGVIYGYNDQIKEWLKRNVSTAVTATPVSRVSDTVISMGPSAKPSLTPSSLQTFRLPGPRWTVNGVVNPSSENLRQHLLRAHNINCEGCSYSTMIDLHDNAHNRR